MLFSSCSSIWFGGNLGCHLWNPYIPRNPGWKTLLWGVEPTNTWSKVWCHICYAIKLPHRWLVSNSRCCTMSSYVVIMYLCSLCNFSVVISSLTGCSVIEVKLKDNPQEPPPSEGGCPCWQRTLHQDISTQTASCASPRRQSVVILAQSVIDVIESAVYCHSVGLEVLRKFNSFAAD